MSDLSTPRLVTALKGLAPKLQAEGVTALAIFGSRVRGDHHSDSDLDILIDVETGRKFSLLDLVGVKHTIEDELGVEANMFMNRSLEPSFRAMIAADVQPIF
jgi:uncharacterized protein